jgi:hypothetical protein
MRDDDLTSGSTDHQSLGSLFESITAGILALDPNGNSQQHPIAFSGWCAQAVIWHRASFPA